MKIGASPPCRLTCDEHRWGSRAGRERRSVARHVSHARGRLSHAPSVDADEPAAERERGARLDVQRATRLDRDFGRLDSQFGCRLNRDGPAVALNHDAVALAVIDADAVVVDRERLAVVQLELYEALAAVVECQLVTLARLDLTDVVLAIRIRLRRPVLAVPERSDDIGESEVAALEGDEHFVRDFGDEVDAAVL